MDGYVLFKDRPEWSDVQPVPQEEGDNAACPIAYSPEFRDAMDYFRAVVKANETSQRAFDLTTDVATFNPANYSLWHYRRCLLDTLKLDLEEELEYSANTIRENMKNYQVWRAIVERMKEAKYELEFTAEMLVKDSKNYHAWQHRHWCMETFGLIQALPDHGLDYVDQLLTEDMRNNSAWNHRFFLIRQSVGFTPEVAEQELSYSLGYIKRAPSNEAAWNYLYGICKAAKIPLSSVKGLKDTCDEIFEQVPSNFVVSCLVDLCIESNDMDRASELLDLLASKVDVVRKNYWQFRKEQLPRSS